MSSSFGQGLNALTQGIVLHTGECRLASRQATTDLSRFLRCIFQDTLRSRSVPTFLLGFTALVLSAEAFAANSWQLGGLAFYANQADADADPNWANRGFLLSYPPWARSGVYADVGNPNLAPGQHVVQVAPGRTCWGNVDTYGTGNGAGGTIYQNYYYVWCNDGYMGPTLQNLQPEKLLGPPCNGRGNPCNPSNGNKYQPEEDYRSPDASLSFTRSYNSFLGLDMGMGYNWSSPFYRRLELHGNLVQVRSGDGRGEPFTCTNNTCTGDPDTALTLAQDSTGYTLTYRNNATDRYDLTGKLLAETSPAGQITNYYYRTDTGKLDHVTDPFGHTLTFSYDANDRVYTVTDPAGQVIHFTYDSNYNLARVDYPDNTAKIYYYADYYNPYGLTGIAYVDSSGATTRFSTYGYNATTGKAIITQHAQTDNGAPQEKFTLSYDSDVQTTVTDPVNMQEVMTFSANLGVKNLLSNVNQSDGKSLQQTFDLNNNLTCRKDEEGHVTTYSYNATNQRTGMAKGLTGDCGNPVSVSGVTRATSYQYLSPTLDLPTLITSPGVYSGQNKTTTIQYTDASHPNLPTIITQSGFTPTGVSVSRTVTLGYNANGQVNSIDGPRTDVSDVTTLVYNTCTTGGACGQLQSVTNALGQVTTYDNYDPDGRLLQTTDPNGVVTTYTYDPRGRVKTITQTPPAGSPAIPQDGFTTLLGSTITPSGNASGDRESERRDRHRHKWRRREKTHGSATTPTQSTATMSTSSLTPAATTPSATWQYSYTPWGDISQVTDPDNVTLYYTYDAAHYLRTVSDMPNLGGHVCTASTGDCIGYSYDLKGNRTVDATYDPTGVLTRTLSYSYDLRNHLASVTEGNNLNVTQLVFDAVGNLSSDSPNSDGVNRTTQYQYDALNRLLQIVDAVNGINNPTRFGYDTNDRQTAVTPPNNLGTTYQYDDLGNRLSEVSPDRGTMNYVYDAAGNVLTQTDARGQTTTYTYDALNRVLTQQSSADFTKPYQYLYDSCYRGRLCSVSDGAMPAMYFGYDGLGRMNYSRDGYNGLASQFAWSPGGRLTRITDPTGRTVDYTYDTLGRVNAVSTAYNGTTTVLAANISYYPFGPMAAFGFGNGLTYQAQFDSAYRPTLRNDGPLAENITNYDGADNILARTIPQNQSFTYDALNRLGTATDNSAGGFGALSYLYDPNGNRSSETRNGTASPYSYVTGTEWLSQAGSEMRQYNPDGSTTSTTALGALTYDGYGELTGAAGASYAYDPFGRRDWKSAGNTTTAFAYGPNGALLYEASGSSTKSYVYLNGVPLARVDNNSRIYYYHDDHLGAPQAMTDSGGNVVWQASYEPFGAATVSVNAVGNNLRFPGQYFDQETGLYYNGARYYDPGGGRYISSDPIGLIGGLNTYLYASANPLRFVDPLGLCKIQVRYAQILEITGLGYPIKIYHAYLVTTDTDGTQKYFRGGPSGFGIPNWGSIKARYGDYVPGTVDWDPGAPPTDTILNNDSPCGCYNATLKQAAKDLNEAKVPYDPLGPNSNSTANFGLQRMNLGEHRPSVIAPGWGDPLIP